MGITVDLDGHRKANELARELEGISRALATHSLIVELAVRRRDWLAAHDRAEVVKEHAARFTEVRTSLLVLGRRSHPSGG